MHQNTSDDIQYVCVSHRHDIFARHVGGNPHVPAQQVTLYENHEDNIAIPVRYNHFIENSMADGWVVFMHHDMQFDEPLASRLHDLPQDAIYGLCGVRILPGRRYMHIKRLGRWRLAVRRGRHFGIEIAGEIGCQKRLAPSGRVGFYRTDLPVVDTVDCCCVIVHASLIRRHGLRFATEFAWHLYAEELSLRARRDHGISTRVLQVDCGHFGDANKDDHFHELLERLTSTYGSHGFASTCYLPEIPLQQEQLMFQSGILINY